MTYIPRPAQMAMLSGLSKRPRSQLIGGMGTGKTGALIVHSCAQQLQYGTFPGMFVLAPQLVCRAWAREIPNWAPELRPALVLGSSQEKAAALQRGGDVYLMNYEALDWLHTYMGKTKWDALGKIMVCDESTRVKHVRSSWQTSSTGLKFIRAAGGVNMNALSRHVTDFHQWINATGTVSPNGLLDLWGQYWWLDGGARLGNSFTDFQQRYFHNTAPYGSYPKYDPLPGAMDEISKLVADITVTVRTEDYYSLDAPRVVRRFVDLPDKGRKAYDDIAKTMMAEIAHGLQTHSITVETASAKIRKLLQAAAGFVYNRDEDTESERSTVTTVPLHEAKLDAIQSILEETNEPLLVVYFHRGFQEMLRKRYKDKVVFIEDQNFDRAQDEWNAGRIMLLSFQYSKGAYGLSLQHGGRNICFAEPTYISDHYSQAIERLGSMRQAQSGYARTVNVFELCGHRTEDARVFDVAQGKITLEQAFTLAVRDAGLLV